MSTLVHLELQRRKKPRNVCVESIHVLISLDYSQSHWWLYVEVSFSPRSHYC